MMESVSWSKAWPRFRLESSSIFQLCSAAVIETSKANLDLSGVLVVSCEMLITCCSISVGQSSIWTRFCCDRDMLMKKEYWCQITVVTCLIAFVDRGRQ